MSLPQSAPSVPGQIAHIDWLSFTIPNAAGIVVELWRTTLAPLLGLDDVVLKDAGAGWNGYAQRLSIGLEGEFGLIAFGGASQRDTVHVSLDAHGCARVPDWAALSQWGTQSGAKIARLDLAHDDREGITVNLATAKRWLDEGGFSTNGRPPSRKLVDDLGTGEGSTLYVGKRKNGKVCRAYEKGKQLGDPRSPWFRVEVEWRGKDRVIPWDALMRPGEYLAGAYPCLSFLSVVQDKLRTCKQATQLSYERMQRWLRTAAGSAIFAMLKVHRGDPDAVLVRIVGDAPPRRLVDFERYLPTPPDGGKGLIHVTA